MMKNTLFVGFLFALFFGLALASTNSALAHQTGVERSSLSALVIPSLLPSSVPQHIAPNTFVISQAADGPSNYYWYLIGSKNNVLLEMLPVSLQDRLSFDNDSIIDVPYSTHNYFSSVTDAVKSIESIKLSSISNDNFIFDVNNRVVLLAETNVKTSSESFNAQVIEISMTNSRQKSMNTRTRRRMKMGAITMSAEVDTEGDDPTDININSNAGDSTPTTTSNNNRPKRKIVGFLRDHHTPIFPVHSQSFFESPSYQFSLRQTIQHAISLSSILIVNANVVPVAQQLPADSPQTSPLPSSDDTDGSVSSLHSSKSILTPSIALVSTPPSDNIRDAITSNMEALSSLDARVNHVAELLVYVCMLLITFAVSLIIGGVLWRKFQDHEKQKDYDMMMETV